MHTLSPEQTASALTRRTKLLRKTMVEYPSRLHDLQELARLTAVLRAAGAL